MVYNCLLSFLASKPTVEAVKSQKGLKKQCEFDFISINFKLNNMMRKISEYQNLLLVGQTKLVMENFGQG